MQTKALAIDLDSTLLKDDKNISDYAIDILAKCSAKGIKIGIVTARSEKASERICDIIKPDFLITCGGGKVKIGDRLLEENRISIEESDRIIDWLVGKEAVEDITVTATDGYYTSFDASTRHQDYSHYIYNDFSKPLGQASYKITASIKDDNLGNDLIKLFSNQYILKYTGVTWYGIFNKRGNKLAPLETISKVLNISLKNMVAFGDDVHDIDMLRGCGVGVAVANALEPVRQVADYIADTNENDGVARWIEKNIL